MWGILVPDGPMESQDLELRRCFTKHFDDTYQSCSESCVLEGKMCQSLISVLPDLNSWGEEKIMLRKAGSGRVWEVWPPFAGSELLVLSLKTKNGTKGENWKKIGKFVSVW